MITILDHVERELPSLLAEPVGWRSLYITYEHPHVERLWRPWGAYRVSLHRVHPCADGEAFFHRHPWPSAVKLVTGTYEMGLGYSETDHPPHWVVATQRLVAGVSYEMTDSDGWHWVRPLGGPSLSVMVTGAPWDKRLPAPGHEMTPLAPEAVSEMLALFRGHYPLGPVM